MHRKAAIAILLLIISCVRAWAWAGDKKPSSLSNTAGAFNLKLPDGLYLYQQRIKQEVFSPLFIVKEGGLIDPYVLADKIGMEKFVEGQAAGKKFNVYLGREQAGILSAVQLDFERTCESDDSLRDISGKGIYEGQALSGDFPNKSLYVVNKFITPPVASIKAVVAPGPLLPRKTEKEFAITDKDKKNAIDAVKRKLVKAAVGRIKERSKRIYGEPRKIIKKEGVLYFLKALDIDGNGKKDLIGKYILYVSHRGAGDSPGRVHVTPSEILFVLFDDGKAENILSTEDWSPVFIPISPIDLDSDGVQEIIVMTAVNSATDEGKRIVVMRRGHTGWEEIYSTVKICCPLRKFLYPATGCRP